MFLRNPAPGSSFVNPAFEKITGYAARRRSAAPPASFAGPDTSTAEILRIDAALQARSRYGRSCSTTARTARPSGWRSRPMSPGARRPARILRLHRAGCHRARKKAEEALREQERSMATLFSNLPGMAYRCRNDGFWTMEFVSAGCRDLTGYEPDALLGNRVTSFEQIIDPRTGRPCARLSRGRSSGARRSSSPTASARAQAP
jgi:PAS domain-containing protein